MKVALINPAWRFDGSIYFGCRDPHLPVELGYARALLQAAGHEAEIFDAQADGLDTPSLVALIADFEPAIAVITTAPSYLFWRCAPPELRVPQELVRALRGIARRIVAVGPHASTTPEATLRKLGADAVVVGECEDILPALASDRTEWGKIDALCLWRGERAIALGRPHTTDIAALPALRWPDTTVSAHKHHHHRFDAPATGPGAEMESSRGCPYHCTFCAKDNFRNGYRRRPLPIVLAELDALIDQGVEYVYFIDEIFLPSRDLLQALARRDAIFGIQTRIDLWTPELLDLLGRAGCVSIEAGIESISEQGRNLLDKNSRLTTTQLADRLAYARERVPFVQANLIDASVDAPDAVERWRTGLLERGVWANKPVPLFPYPGSPDYARRWGAADDRAWERALDHYLQHFDRFSDIQDERPLPLAALELPAPPPPSAWDRT